jgi:glycosyltransferase involved in cell wall biosynthesis
LSISVVIPAYRAARTIARAVNSVLGQSLAPAEILVVDDGSPDGDETARILEQFGDRVRLLRKLNGGAASARNHGIDFATSDVIAFLDADDYWQPQKLAIQCELFAKYPDVGVVASQWFTQIPGEEPVAPGEPIPGIYDRRLAVSGPVAFDVATKLLTSTVAVRREVLGNHRFVSGLEPAEDRDLWCRLVASAAVYLTSTPLITYVLEAGSLSRTKVDRDYGNMIRVVHRHAGLLGRQATRLWETITYRKWASCYLAAGQPRAALRPALQRLRRQPLSAEAWWIAGKCLALSCRIRSRQQA